jgi:hypothetical protein
VEDCHAKRRKIKTLQPVQVPKSIKQPTENSHQKKKKKKKKELIRFLCRHGTRIKLAKVRLGLSEKRIRLPILNNATSIQDNDTIEVEDCVEFVSDRDNSVITEFLSDNPLHNFICFGIDAVARCVSLGSCSKGCIGVWAHCPARMKAHAGDWEQ